MQEIILTVGPPAIGKSTWALKKIKDNPGKFIRINRDSLRVMTGETDENVIRKSRDILLKQYLKEGKNVIIDDTNLRNNAMEIVSNIVCFLDGDFVIREKHFDKVDVQVLIERDAARSSPVGERVIRTMYAQWLGYTPKPDKYVGVQKDAIINSLMYSGKKAENLPEAIIVDVDGTIALHNTRSPYDFKAASTDFVNYGVVDIVRAVTSTGVKAILVSGRNENSKDVLLEWLERNDLSDLFSDIYMRPEDKAYEKDWKIKAEIYDKYIEPHYNVIAVFDDRDSVVNMWRTKFVTCLQTWEGDF